MYASGTAPGHVGARAIGRSRLGTHVSICQDGVALAVELAESALQQADSCRGWRDQTAAFLYVLAVSRHKAGIHRTAQALETRALEHVRQIAATIEDRDRKKAWVSAPINQEILNLVDR
mgnify:CR=1 FL=1